ncbi:hypothetical protein ACHHYP_12674 [Achlya hypogyna]|uniref:Uncharacterized protein n=1 Tax=Achlya hypogyna TaxID=1202772 RepID=A0A1V9ZGN7_ACHHY|nr:hypothetical protein ACHHYP_12674 [Achlya hypogyna]
MVSSAPPSIFREPPLGVRRPAAADHLTVLPGPKRPEDASSRLWVQHARFPTIKKACGTPESFRGMKRQTSARVLQELRSAKAVVDEQLEDFRRKLQELDLWIAAGHTAPAPSSPQHMTKKKHSKKRAYAGETTRDNATMPLTSVLGDEAQMPTTQPLVDSIGLPPPAKSLLDPNIAALPDDSDAPCTTKGCWQFVCDLGFFQPLTTAMIERALEIEHTSVSSPMEPTTDSDDGSPSSSLVPCPPPHRAVAKEAESDASRERLTSNLLDAVIEVANEVDDLPPEKPADGQATVVELDGANIYLRKELVAIGVVPKDDETAADDEISAELRKCERQLHDQLQQTNRLKSLLYLSVQARAAHEANDTMEATLKKYHKLLRKQDSKRKRKHAAKHSSKRKQLAPSSKLL